MGKIRTNPGNPSLQNFYACPHATWILGLYCNLLLPGHSGGGSLGEIRFRFQSPHWYPKRHGHPVISCLGLVLESSHLNLVLFTSVALWSLSHVLLFAPSQTGAHQALLPMWLPRQDWTGVPFYLPVDLPDLGIEPASLASSALAGEFFTPAPFGKPFSLSADKINRHWSIANWK